MCDEVSVDVVVYKHAYDKTQGVLYTLACNLGLFGQRSHFTAWALVMHAEPDKRHRSV